MDDRLLDVAVAEVGPGDRVEPELEVVRRRRRVLARARTRPRRPPRAGAARRPRSGARRARARRSPTAPRPGSPRPGSPPDRALHRRRRRRPRPRSQKSALRYFQPPSARIVTTTPSSSSAARRRATCDDGAAGDAAEDRPPGGGASRTACDGLLVRDEHLAIELRDVEDRRHVAVVERAEAHHRVAGQRLGGGDDDVGERLAQPLAGAHQRAAGAEPGDEHVDAVERLGDLGARALVVRARVGLVRVLERA